MRTKNILKSLATSVFLILFSTACSDFLDINEDPNNPTTASLQLLLPSIQVDVAGSLGNSIGGLSAIPQAYVHQMFQRGTTEGDYGVNGADFEVITPWTILYTRGLNDVEQVIAQGTELEAWAHVGVAQIMKAYAFSLMVDMYGDVPYFEAFKGTENLSPAYDDDEVVYDALLALIDEAIVNLNTTAAVTMGGEDLIYAGDLSKWQKFAKSVKLKMLTQMRLVRNVSTEVSALITEGDLILASNGSEDFQLVYGTSTGPDNRNPAYVQEWTPGAAQFYINPMFYETLASLNSFGHHGYSVNSGLPADPRIPYYFYNQLAPGENAENPCSYCDLDVNGNPNVPELAGTGFLSIYMFSFNIDPDEGFDQSASQTIAGLYPVGGAFDAGTGAGVTATSGNPAAPQRFLDRAAINYLMAELYLSGEATGDDAVALETAIRESFGKVNELATLAGASAIATASIDSYVTAVMADYTTQDDAGKLEHIITQKWIASFGFAIDAYTDYRRTGFPVLHDGNTDNLTVTNQVRQFPYSLPWVNSNLEINANAPAQKQIATDAARIFWDPN